MIRKTIFKKSLEQEGEEVGKERSRSGSVVEGGVWTRLARDGPLCIIDTILFMSSFMFCLSK